jgi:flagellar biosynthesis/type III secretory pathway M-ring protein FliF/YscJ
VQYVLVGVVVLVIAWFVTAPLRRPRDDGRAGDERDARERAEARVAEIELRKESKYREIRDAQLDRAAGKLSDEDFRRMNAELRREAVAILAELDLAQAEARRNEGPGPVRESAL